MSSSVREVQVTGHSGNPPGQGPFMKVTLRVVGNSVAEATYETYQCPGCHACGKAICDLIRGKRFGEASAVKHADLVSLVGPLPRHRQICYGLALIAVADAFRQMEDQSG